MNWCHIAPLLQEAEIQPTNSNLHYKRLNELNIKAQLSTALYLFKST